MSKVQCNVCGALILEATASKFEGRCAPCEKQFQKDFFTDTSLAPRYKRLLASLVDCVIGILIMLPLLVFTDYWLVVMAVAKQGQMPPLSYMVSGVAYSFGVFFAINWKFLSREGQTIGKKVVDVSIRNLDGSRVPMDRLMLRRMLPYYGFYYIPVVGDLLGMVNLLFIFGKKRRCLHDLIAKTKVVNVNANKSMHSTPSAPGD